MIRLQAIPFRVLSPAWLAVTLVALAFVSMAPSSALSRCLPDLAKRDIVQSNGPNIRLHVTQGGQYGTPVTGTADWVDESWLNLVDQATVTGSTGYDHISLRLAWSNRAHKVGWYDADIGNDGTLYGVTYVEGNPMGERAKWNFAGGVFCLPETVDLAIAELDKPHAKLSFSVEPKNVSLGEFQVFRAQALVKTVARKGFAAPVTGVYFVPAGDKAAYHVCYAAQSGWRQCSGDVHRPWLNADVKVVRPIAQSGALRDSAVVTQGMSVGRNPATCASGYVWRVAGPEDLVCVVPEARARVAQENRQAEERRDPGAGWGPNGCRSGYVWRDAFAGDQVCVTPESRALAAAENRAAPERRAQ